MTIVYIGRALIYISAKGSLVSRIALTSEVSLCVFAIRLFWTLTKIETFVDFETTIFDRCVATFAPTEVATDRIHTVLRITESLVFGTLVNILACFLRIHYCQSETRFASPSFSELENLSNSIQLTNLMFTQIPAGNQMTELVVYHTHSFTPKSSVILGNVGLLPD